MTARKKRTSGSLVIIGGHEDRQGEMRILREVARLTGKGALVVTTVASHSAADELWQQYRGAFEKIGVEQVVHLDLSARADSMTPERLSVLEEARTVFFTGGDQLRITSVLGGTAVLDSIRQVFLRGGCVAGTSAGASAVSHTMLLSGRSGETPRLEKRLGMAPGLGFLQGVIVDQHFAERGRIGRLLGAVALNPSELGMGIDEDTAIVVSENRGTVIGSGGVYVVDATAVSDTNVSDGASEGALSLFNVRLDVLSEGDRFDFTTRQPLKGSLTPR